MHRYWYVTLCAWVSLLFFHMSNIQSCSGPSSNEHRMVTGGLLVWQSTVTCPSEVLASHSSSRGWAEESGPLKQSNISMHPKPYVYSCLLRRPQRCQWCDTSDTVYKYHSQSHQCMYQEDMAGKLALFRWYLLQGWYEIYQQEQKFFLVHRSL